MKDYNRVYQSESFGKEFEELVVFALAEFLRKKYGANSYSFATEVMDKIHGTDFTALEVPIDVTLNAKYKDHTSWLKSIDFNWLNVKLGLRTRNKVAKFEKPVLVLGFDGEITRQNLAFIIGIIKKNVEQILEAAWDTYWEVVPE